MSSIRVLIVEDEALIAEDIRDCLLSQDYEVIDVVHNAEDAILSIEKNQLDVALLDINLHGHYEGIELGKLITNQYNFPFVYLTSYAHKFIIEKAKITRPMGYIVKPFSEKDLFTTLEIALYNYNIDRRPQVLSLEALNSRLSINKLTEREFETLESIFEGMTNKQISNKLFVSPNTIKTHIKNLYLKIGAHSRAEIIRIVREILQD